MHYFRRKLLKVISDTDLLGWAVGEGEDHERVHFSVNNFGKLKLESNCQYYRDHELAVGRLVPDHMPKRGDYVIVDILSSSTLVCRWRFADISELPSDEVQSSLDL